MIGTTMGFVDEKRKSKASREVKRYYADLGIKEWRRLERNPYRELEFTTTMHFLKKYLPKRGLILDAGGGPGRYTIELAKRGYGVVLIDIVPKQLKIARRKIKKAEVERKVKKIVEGNIVNLSMFKDNTFDAVLCIGGPLSHVLTKSDREKAAKELVRVAKKKAPIFVSGYSRFAVMIHQLAKFPAEIPHLLRKLRDTGDYFGGFGFTPSHFFLPEELKELFEKNGVKTLNLVASHGLASTHEKEVNRLFKDKEKWKIWMETHLKTCTYPSVASLGEHMMLIGKKR